MHMHAQIACKVTKKNPYTQVYGLKNDFFLYFATKNGYFAGITPNESN